MRERQREPNRMMNKERTNHKKIVFTDLVLHGIVAVIRCFVPLFHGIKREFRSHLFISSHHLSHGAWTNVRKNVPLAHSDRSMNHIHCFMHLVPK